MRYAYRNESHRADCLKHRAVGEPKEMVQKAIARNCLASVGSITISSSIVP